MPNAMNVFETTLSKQFDILVSKSVDIYLNAIRSYSDGFSEEEQVRMELHEPKL